jgi:hypothetical protein
MGADEVGTAHALREHREAVRPIVLKHGGRIVKTTGDGVLLEFPSVAAAVECAVAVQKLMAERNAGMAEGKRMLFRIGVNVGDVIIDGEDILGDGVNVAARLEGIAEPGGISLSGDAYRQIKGKIELAVRDLGEQRLKNIAEPVPVYSVIVNGSMRFGDGAQGKTPPVSSDGVSSTYRFGTGIAGAAIVLIAVVVGVAWFNIKSGPPSPMSQAPRLSIVVLPFTNLSGDAAQDYLADVITEGLTSSLARISGTGRVANVVEI